MIVSDKNDRPPIRILLIDDHELVLAGMRLLIESEPGFKVIGEARNRSEAIQATSKQPDIILLDLNLGAENSLDFLAELIEVSGKSRVVVLTGIPDVELHLRAVCLGAVGVVSKLEKTDVLMKAIHKVHAGEVWLNRTMMANAMNQTRRGKKTDPIAVKISGLTGRELDVITVLAEGRRNKEIAERLLISEKTVRHYLTSIFSKLEVADRLELIIFSYQHGLAEIPSRQ